MSLRPTIDVMNGLRARNPPLAAAAVVGAGLAIGIVTKMLQGVLPDGWAVLANSGVMWALSAFVLGMALPSTRWAAIGGAAALVIASISYYLAVDGFAAISSSPQAVVIWSVAGIVAGAVFGVTGYWFIDRAPWRPACGALIAGVLVGEGIHLTWFVGNLDLHDAGIVELAAGIAIASACLASSRPWVSARTTSTVIAALIGATTATLAAGSIINLAFVNG
jgi:Family of unknown function (DUF6518)